MIPLPNKKYDIVYCDPPWKYGFWYQSEDVKRNAADHYDVMSMSDLQTLPVKDICNTPGIILMWATFPCLEDAISLMYEWGFVYKTVAFVWVKRNKKADSWFFGLGNYTRANAEVCLLGVRKKGAGLPVIDRSVSQIIDSRITTHSRKPPEVRDKIIKVFGDIPRIELFATEQVDGWDTWGNGVYEAHPR